MSISEEKFKIGTTYLLPFEKLHGLGNDFVLVNNAHLPEDSHSEYEQALTKKICDRNRGIGGDGLIVIDNVKESSEAIRSWRYYNSDGSIGEMCGNGIRCAAKYIYEHGLSGEEAKFKIETLAGDIGIELLDDEMVKVDMGPPREIIENLKLNIENFEFDYTYVSMGNPHAIAFFDDIEAVKHHGPAIELHKNFPNKTNVEFAQILLKESCREKSSDTRLASSEQAELTGVSMFRGSTHLSESINAKSPDAERIIDNDSFSKKNERNVVDEALRGSSDIKLIVWERGCGFTQACGTGACATVVAAILNGYSKKDEDITVQLPGGDLIIRWDSVAETIFMTGKAEMSFLGYYNA